MLETLDNNTLIIIPNNIKRKVIKEINELELLNIKIMTINELKEELLFKYRYDAIYYLFNKYHYKIEVIKMYLDNLYYIEENKKYNNAKLDKLVSFYNELNENGLIIKNDYFKYFLKEHHVVFYGFDYLTKFENNMINKIREYTDVIVLLNKENESKRLTVSEYFSTTDEVEAVAYKISELLDQNVPINSIKLINVNEEYYNILKRMFNYYNIPVLIPNNDSIIGTNIIKEFLELIEDNTRETVINKLILNHKNASNKELELINTVIDILNKYNWYDGELIDIKELLIYDLSMIKSTNISLKNMVEITDIESVDKDDYVFILGFNQGRLPRVIKNEKYITDDIVDLVDIDSTLKLMDSERNSLINRLYGIDNLFISYKKYSLNSEVYPSSLINDLSMEVIKQNVLISPTYSSNYQKLKYSMLLDNLIKYKEIDDNLAIFNHNYKDIDYLSYDNRYKGIDKDSLAKYLNKKLVLSYSKLDDYYKCNFKYLVNVILKLGHYEETFITFVGNLYHMLFSKCYNDDFDFEKEYNSFINNSDKELSLKEETLLIRLKEELRFIINELQENKKDTKLNKMYFEHKVNLKIPSSYDVTFKGFIDKIMYEEKNNETLISIIDYKTGKKDVSLKYINHGLGMQLPMYLYLVKKSEMFNNPKIVGFYLQNVLTYDNKVPSDKSYAQRRKDGLKLNGYSTDNTLYLSRFDPTYEDSSYINSMKVTKNGFAWYTKIVTDNKVEEIVNSVDENIKKATKGIIDAKFDINPKMIKGKNESCAYCEFKDICFMTNDNLVRLKEGEDSE